MQEVGFISPHPGGRLDASEAPGPQPACRLGLWVCLPRYNPALRTFRWVGSECPGCVRYSQQTICRCSATPSPPCEGRRTDGNTTWRYRATTQVPPEGWGYAHPRPQDKGLIRYPRGIRAPHVEAFVDTLLAGGSLTAARRAANAASLLLEPQRVSALPLPPEPRTLSMSPPPPNDISLVGQGAALVSRPRLSAVYPSPVAVAPRLAAAPEVEHESKTLTSPGNPRTQVVDIRLSPR